MTETAINDEAVTGTFNPGDRVRLADAHTGTYVQARPGFSTQGLIRVDGVDPTDETFQVYVLHADLTRIDDLHVGQSVTVHDTTRHGRFGILRGGSWPLSGRWMTGDRVTLLDQIGEMNVMPEMISVAESSRVILGALVVTGNGSLAYVVDFEFGGQVEISRRRGGGLDDDRFVPRDTLTRASVRALQGRTVLIPADATWGAARSRVSVVSQGRVGTVTSRVPDLDGDVQVSLTGGGHVFVQYNQVEFPSPVETPTVGDSPFVVGDRVRCLSTDGVTSASLVGELATVRTVDDATTRIMLGVEFDEGTTRNMYADRFVRVLDETPSTDPTPQVAPVDNTRLRTLLNGFVTEGHYRGYDGALAEFRPWFETTFGTGLEDYAGTQHILTGTVTADLTIAGGSRMREVTIPISRRVTIVGDMGRVASIGTKAIESTFPPEQQPSIRLTDTRSLTWEESSRQQQDLLTPGEDPERTILTWIGRKAEEDGWCPEYESFCAKAGVPSYRGGTEQPSRFAYDVTVDVTSMVTLSLADTGSALDSEITSNHFDSLNEEHGWELGSLAIEAEASMVTTYHYVCSDVDLDADDDDLDTWLQEQVDLDLGNSSNSFTVTRVERNDD